MPLPKQKVFHESDAFCRLYQGGFGAGKSLAGCWEALDVSLAYPRNVGIIARKTYRELEDSTKRIFFEICPPEVIKSWRARDDTLTLTNDSVIMFRSLDDPQKFRSINLGWFYIDEASEIEDEDIPTMLLGRLRLATVPWRGGWFTTNPSHVEHWTYKWFVERASQNAGRYFMVSASSYENPHLPPDYVKQLEADYSQAWIRRYLMGEFGFITAGTLVYPDFNEKVHIGPVEWLRDRPIYRSWDFGFHHPALLFSQVGPDKQWRVLKEMMGDRILLSKFAEEVVLNSNTWYPGAPFIDVGDPAGRQHGDKDERSSVEVLRDKFNIRLISRRQPKKRLIELVNTQFSRFRKVRESEDPMPVVRISDFKGPKEERYGCPVLIEGLRSGYVYPKAKDGHISKDSPMEDGYFEHLQDCLQYAAAAIFLGGSLSGSVEIREPKWNFN